MEVTVNYFAVLVSAILAVGLGFLWYGPIFGKQWMAEMGWTRESISERMKGTNMNVTYALQALGSLVMAYVLAHFVVLLNVTNTAMALQFSFWSWLGLVATTHLGLVLWEGKTWKFYAITTGYYLVTIALMALILSAWR